ncbi:MAG: DUF4861 domain-containing protein [Muribaculaceae bacterium]|nr:DUF4861 domain-containing protein [Muribaculaceae bacterium]
MKYFIFSLSLTLTVIAAGCSGSRHSITVENSSDITRVNEIVETDFSAIDDLMGGGQFIMLDSAHNEITYQITYDGKLLFPASVAPHSVAVYHIVAGEPSVADTIACGGFYPARKDDMTWENDRSAFRAYGPALQQSGERAFGYDIWTKSVAHPVVARRYDDAFNNGKSFHDDHGDGMDVYTVGPTLGGGTAALLDSLGDIVLPYCFSSYEILDNGPLRFTVRLQYESSVGPEVTETRTISLDAGEFLNRTTVCFNGLTHSMEIAPGIVVHRQNPEGYSIMKPEGVMAYADLTDNMSAGNGVIYVGVVTIDPDSIYLQPLETEDGDAVGHLLARSTYNPDDCYTYYWGSGWSKGSMPDWTAWKDYLATFRSRIDNPLKITVE